MRQLIYFGKNPDIPCLLQRATDGSAAYDIIAAQDIVVTETPQFVDLGFHTAYDPDVAALILPRSGQGVKYGVQLANTVGLIDSDYRLEWKAKLMLNDQVNNVLDDKCALVDGVRELVIKKDTALAQVLFVPVIHFDNIVSVVAQSDLPPSGRIGGFGSTDK